MRRKVLEVLAILACMLFAGSLWAALQDVELEARLQAANETIRLYMDSTALLRAICLPMRSTSPQSAPLHLTVHALP